MNIIEFMQTFSAFAGSSWDGWRAILAAIFGLPLTQTQAQRVAELTGRGGLSWLKRLTGRRAAPKSGPAREAWLVMGRRSGKSLTAALIALYLAVCRAYSSLAPGERGTVMLIASDRRQARVLMSYVIGLLESRPELAEMIARKTQDTVELSNGVIVGIHTASFRSTRGYTLLGVICDEIAFWRDETSANPDTEVVQALRPAIIPGGLLVAISGPYARRGILWRTYERHYGKDSTIFVAQASTEQMNPSVDTDVIKQAYLDDPAGAAAEYGALFRSDLESFIAFESVQACVDPGCLERARVLGIQYTGFVDPSGGSQDSFTLAISHAEGDLAVLDLVREVTPPFSPESVTSEFAATLQSYGITSVVGDRYGGQWPAEQFKKYGVTYQPSERAKSDIYQSALPLLNSGRVRLLDISRLSSQLLSLERRTARGGRDSIDHPPSGRDDLINSAAGALVLAAAGAARRPLEVWGGRSPLQAGLELSAEAAQVLRAEAHERLVEAIRRGGGAWIPGRDRL